MALLSAGAGGPLTCYPVVRTLPVSDTNRAGDHWLGDYHKEDPMRRPLIACAGAVPPVPGAGLSYTLVNGVRVPFDAQLGQPYAAPLSTGSEDGWTFTLTGTIPPGVRVPRQYGATHTSLGRTPAQQGTFTVTLPGYDFSGVPIPPQTYQVPVGSSLPLTVVLPGSGQRSSSASPSSPARGTEVTPACTSGSGPGGTDARPGSRPKSEQQPYHRAGRGQAAAQPASRPKRGRDHGRANATNG